MTAALADGLTALEMHADAAAQATLSQYLALLDKWNRTHNLTAIRDPKQMVTHHLLDSLAALEHLPDRVSLRVLDMGSGGGLPGIPLAIARPEWRVVLLDSNQKKAVFLRQAVIELKLANVEVCAVRVQDYEVDPLFDVVISRAFSDLASFASLGRRLVASGGWLVAMKGLFPHEELQQVPADVRVVSVPPVRVPGLDVQRHLVIMEPQPA
ncbi:MAG: 16S rRNA (guanine(527)-N(7))-methyltransferase RsmG [Pseudomonadota bacterium]|nr:16S rRNA (guanine(527)-N(7))-methyltransferase RsmG [Pseudomonadota bacterium]